MIAVAKALPFALKHWKALFGGLVLLGLVIALAVARGDARHWKKVAENRQQALADCEANHRQFADDVKAKTAAALQADLADKARVEAEQQRIQSHAESDIRARITAAVNRVRTTHSTTAHSSGGGGEGLSSPAGTTGHSHGAHTASELPPSDLEICATNTVLAESWQSWWHDVSAIPR